MNKLTPYQLDLPLPPTSQRRGGLTRWANPTYVAKVKKARTDIVIWNRAMDEYLIRSRNSGMTFLQCSDGLGVAQATARSRAIALGIWTPKPRKPTHENRRHQPVDAQPAPSTGYSGDD